MKQQSFGQPSLTNLPRLFSRRSVPMTCQEVALSIRDLSVGIGDDADRRVAAAIVSGLKSRIGEDRFELWFDEPNCIRLTSSDLSPPNVTVLGGNQFEIQRIQNTFGREIRDVVDTVLGQSREIRFAVIKDDGEGSNSSRIDNQKTLNLVGEISSTRPVASGQRKTAIRVTQTVRANEAIENDSTATPRPHVSSLNSFWFGEENALAKAGVDQVLERPGQLSPFFVYGPAGSGKTHLVEAIVRAFRRRLRLRRCVFLSAEQFTTQFVGSLRNGSGLPLFRRKYRDLDLLAIDDIQFLAGKRATLNEFQHTIDNLIRNGKQIVVSADRSPLELNPLGADLNTRLTSGLTCPIHFPAVDGRKFILRQLCRDRGIQLPQKVLDLIAERLKCDVRRLSGAVNRLFAVQISTGRKITPEIAQTELGELFSIGTANSTSLTNIEQAVCEFCGIKPKDLKSSSRRKQISTARMLAMFLSRNYTSSALSEIGEFFGGRSHSTVIAAKRKVSHWLENDEGVELPNAKYPIREAVRRLKNNLRIG